MDHDDKTMTEEYTDAAVVTEQNEDKMLREAEKVEMRRERNSRKVEKMLEKKRRKEHKARHGMRPDKEEPINVPDEAVEADVQPDDDQIDEEREADAKRDKRLQDQNAKKLEKLMEKKRKREENSDRDVLTYEDLPLEERDPQVVKKRKIKRKRITIAVVIVLLLSFAVYIFTNSDKLSLHNISNFIQYGLFNRDSDQRFPVTIRGENISSGNFARMGQDLCYASDTKVETLNNYGKRMLTVQHGYSTPVLVACDDYSLVYGLGSTGFRINSLDEQVFSGSADNNILVADIVNNGTYALVTQSDGYLSKLTVYDSKNSKIYAYSFADYYITSVSLKSNGKMAVVSGLSAHNGSEMSSLYVLDFTKETPAQFVELEDTVIYDVQYLTDTYAAAIGSSGAYGLNTGNGRVESTSYDGKTLTAYTFNKDTSTFSISLSRSGDGRSCDIYSFGSSGSLSSSFSTDLRVISLSSYKGRVALLTTDMIYLYSKGGSLVNRVDAGVDPRCVVLYTTSDAYVLDTSEIRSVSL